MKLTKNSQWICGFICLILFEINIALTIPKCSPNDPKPIILDSTSGKLKGSCSFVIVYDKMQMKSGNVYSWLSVPYAEPPVNDKRFQPPEPVKPWSDIRDATTLPNSCMQLINRNISSKLEFTNIYGLLNNSKSQISEDCLYLNIWTPIEAIVKEANYKGSSYKAPIMVVFHGGDSIGSSVLDIQNPSIFAAMTGTIVVTINYRLDIFGFLYLNNEENGEIIGGNQGFLDQHLALKWIYENAEKFGGDPSRITLMGYGSGSLFASYHLIYKPSWPLFKNIILQSGSPVNLAKNFLSFKAASNRTKLFLQTFYTTECSTSSISNNLSGENKTTLFDCLKDINANNLTISSRIFQMSTLSKNSKLASSFLKSAFVPIVDNKTFFESPNRSFREGRFKKCNIIMGFNNHDGASQIPLNYGIFNETPRNLNKNDARQRIDYQSLVEFLKRYYMFYPTWPTENNEIFFNIILNEYTQLTPKNFKESSNLVIPNYIFTLRKLLTDEAYACPIFKFLEYLAKANTKVYLYVYNHRMATSKWPFWYGVVNGEELASVFGQPFNDIKNINNELVSANPWKPFANYTFSPADKFVSKEVITKWANFIFNDDPNKPIGNPLKLRGSDTFWPEFRLSKLTQRNKIVRFSSNSRKDNLYFIFRTNGTQVMRLPNQGSCVTWNSLIPSNLESFGIKKLTYCQII